MFTKSDKKYIDEKFVSKNEFFDALEEMQAIQKSDHDEEMKVLQDLAGKMNDFEDDKTVLTQHNSEHFDKDDEQDKRLDAHGKKLGLPAFTY